jgi:stage II sporulation protein AA (anti-sigma F factor antagonist)
LGIKHERKRDTLIAHLEGELDHHHAEEIREELDGLLNDPSIKNLVFNLEHLHFMDSSGIGVFIGRYKRITKRGGIVCIVRVNPQIHKILEMSGLYKILKVYIDVKAALNALRGVS